MTKNNVETEETIAATTAELMDPASKEADSHSTIGHRRIAYDLLGESTRISMLYCDGISEKHRGRYEYDYCATQNRLA